MNPIIIVMWAGLAVGAIAYPAKYMSGSVTFTLRTGESRHPFSGMTISSTFGSCIKLGDPRIPSDIQLDKVVGKSTLYKYHLVGHSSSDCSDDSIVRRVPMKIGSSTRLNERTPICSFELGRNPWAESPTTVQFNLFNGKQSKPYHTAYKTNNNNGCFNMCSSNNQLNKYPFSVEILEQEGKVANNFLKLFSNENCAGDSQIRYQNSYEIPNFADLVSVTKLGDEENVIRSISIVYNKRNYRTT